MSSLNSYLTTIADAIRQKKGTTEPINASNFASEILSIQAGGSLNVAYSLTPPTDTSKIWLKCAEPSGVEVQNYIGNVSVGEVVNYGGIDNPVSGHSSFYSDYYSSCYIGNNQIAIVGYNHIRIYDLTSKNYIADYTISVGTSNYYGCIYKDNILYFGYQGLLYSFDLSTQTLTLLYTYSTSSGYYIRYIFFHSDNEIDVLYGGSYYSYHCRFNLDTNTNTQIKQHSGSAFTRITNHTIKVGNTIYNFYIYNAASNSGYNWKYDLSNDTFTIFTSFYNFMNDLGWTEYKNSSVIYDGERFIYLIGGKISGITHDNIIRYDIVNDSFEVLDQKLIEAKCDHFNILVDNRVYIFGGKTWTSNNVIYGRPNQIDYFDLQYPLPQNNAIITTNTINTDNALPLINTEKLKINSNIASAYLGNADNLAEKVNAYHHNGYGWVGINCEDYREE